MPQMLDDINYISRNIGPRPAGTEEEQRAAIYISQKLEERSGLPVEVEEFECEANENMAKNICFGVVFIALILAVVMPFFALPSLIVSVVASILLVCEFIDKPILSKYTPRGVSQNIVAHYNPGTLPSNKKKRQRKVILVANYDSDKVLPLPSQKYFKYVPTLNRLSAGIATIAAPVLLLIRVLMGDTSGFLSFLVTALMVISLICLLYPALMFFLKKSASYNEAANYNASGVAVLMDLARKVGTGRVVVDNNQSNNALLHNEETLREENLIPDGVKVTYKNLEDTASKVVQDLSPEERLLRAKAAVAAFSGKPIKNENTISDLSENLVKIKEDEIDSYSEKAAEEQNKEIKEAFKGNIEEVHAEEKIEYKPVKNIQYDGNVPGWYIAAQEKAHKDGYSADEAQISEEQRSHFAQALDIAEIESAGAFKSEFEIEPSEEENNSRNEEEISEKKPEIEETLNEENISSEVIQPETEIPVVIEDFTEEEPKEAEVEPVTKPEIEPVVKIDFVEENENKKLNQNTVNVDSFTIVQESIDEVTQRDNALEQDLPEYVEVTEEEIFTPRNFDVEEESFIQKIKDSQILESIKEAFKRLKNKIDFKIEQRKLMKQDEEQQLLLESPKNTEEEVEVIPIVVEQDSEENLEVKEEHEEQNNIKEECSESEDIIENEDIADKTTSMPVIDVSNYLENNLNQNDEQINDEKVEGTKKESIAQPAPLADIAESKKNKQLEIPEIPQNLVLEEKGKEEKESIHLDPQLLPSMSGTISVEPIHINTYVSSKGSFTPASSTGAFKPVGDELVEGIDIEDMYIDDTVDSEPSNSVENPQVDSAETYLEIPESRVQKIFKKFSHKKNSEADEVSAHEWLELDDDFEARKAGAQRGSWESFKEEQSEDEWNGGAVQEGSNSIDSDEVLEQIKSFYNPDIDIEVYFVALGAELSNNAGMKSFITKHKEDLKGSVVINLEGLGAGELTTIEEEGEVRKQFASSRIKRAIRKAKDKTKVKPVSANLLWKETAASIAAKKNYPSMTLMGMESGIPSYYHQSDDVVENIEVNKLEENSEFVESIIKNI